MSMAAPAEILHWRDPAAGLNAFCVIDNESLGPAAGGVRTHSYASEDEALDDAKRLAKTMTHKCALAGLPNGGAKVVVMDHPNLNRPLAFRRIGQEVHKLGGRLHVAGDLGTTADDVAVMASQTQNAHAGTEALGQAVGKSVLSCLRGALDGRECLGLSALVQGCGDMGRAVARSFAAAGMRVLVVDLDGKRAQGLADELGAGLVAPGDEANIEVDVFAPCARGDSITEALSSTLKAQIVCGAANHIFASEAAERIFVEKGGIAVPDILSSAGAVIWGMAPLAHPARDAHRLISKLAETTRHILDFSAKKARLPSVAAAGEAAERIRLSPKRPAQLPPVASDR
jgi:leucine dehydrogenase